MLVTNVRVKNGDNYKNIISNILVNFTRTYRQKYFVSQTSAISPSQSLCHQHHYCQHLDKIVTMK